MGEYIKCPRCDLNYIKKGEEYCDVCKAELKKGPQLMFADVDNDEVEIDEIDLCPRCHQNYVKPGEELCESCLKARAREEAEPDPTLEDDESWKEYMDDVEEEEEEESEEMLSLSKLAEEEGDEMFDDEEEEEDIVCDSAEPDDFEIPEIDQADFEDYEEEDEELDDGDDFDDKD